MDGIYAGIPYIVHEKKGKLYIGLPAGLVAEFAAAGADMKLLGDIGDQDPEDVMAAFVETLPEAKDEATEQE